MRTLSAKDVEEAVRDMCMDAGINASDDLVEALERARSQEESELGRHAIERLLENIEVAAAQRLPICQDTGYAVFFVERGEELTVDGPGLAGAIERGMERGYADAYLRRATCHCLTRKNRGDNSPAIVYETSAPGDGLRVSMMAKGGGSENMSGLGMLKPAQGWAGVRDFVVETVRRAGANPCPPVILGVGVGGTFETAALNSKRALLRPLGRSNPDPELAAFEQEILGEVNKLGIGPMGYGGRVTALECSIIFQPCHIASLPVAVNIQCHASRHREIEL